MPAFLSVLVVLLAIGPALADVAPFTTPSGNIQCSAGIDRGTPSDVYCTIFERAGTPPAPGLAKCNDAFGYEFSMRERAPSQSNAVGSVAIQPQRAITP